MVIDHAEIDAMKQSRPGGATATLTAPESTPAEANAPEGPSAERIATPPTATVERTRTSEPAVAQTPAERKLAQILRLKVPAIVQLAQRRSGIGYVRRLTLGMIIEFSKQVDDPLELRINNRTVGRGEAVKVGEHFGLRISEIRDPAERVRTLGK